MSQSIIAADATNVANDVALLRSREAALRAQGKKELANVYNRAAKEFSTGAARGMLGTVGVDHRAVRN